MGQNNKGKAWPRMQRHLSYVNWTEAQARKQTDPCNKHRLHINNKSINGTQMTFLGSRHGNIYTKIKKMKEIIMACILPTSYRTMRNENNVLIFTIKDQ
jgi:hypothetical protein